MSSETRRRRVIVDATLTFDVSESHWAGYSSPVAYIRDHVLVSKEINDFDCEIHHETTREPDRPIAEVIAEAGFTFWHARAGRDVPEDESIRTAWHKVAESNQAAIIEIWDHEDLELSFQVYLPGLGIQPFRLKGTEPLIEWLNRHALTEADDATT